MNKTDIGVLIIVAVVFISLLVAAIMNTNSMNKRNREITRSRS